MVRLDGVDDLRALAVATGEVGADDGVRALDLVVDRFAEVVQKAGALGRGLVEAELGGHDAAERGDLDGVREDVLAEGGAVAQRAQGLHELGVQVVDAGVEGGLLAGLADALVDEGLGLLVELLDAGGVDAAVGDEVLERDAGGLAANGVEARQRHGLGGVVDDERDARDLLERADVAPLAADDAALEVVGGDVDGGHRDLAGLVGGAALNGGRDDLAGGLVGLGADVLLALAQNLGLLADGLGAYAVEELGVGFVAGEAGDALELGDALGLEGVEVDLALVELALEAGELVVATVEDVVAAIEGLLALHDATLHVLELALALLLLRLGGLLDGQDLLLGLEDGLLLCVLGLTGGLGADAVGLGLGVLDLGLGGLDLGIGLTGKDRIRDRGAHHKANNANDDFHTCSSDSKNLFNEIKKPGHESRSSAIRGAIVVPRLRYVPVEANRRYRIWSAGHAGRRMPFNGSPIL